MRQIFGFVGAALICYVDNAVQYIAFTFITIWGKKESSLLRFWIMIYYNLLYRQVTYLHILINHNKYMNHTQIINTYATILRIIILIMKGI